ncbi:hypothetical protein DXX93_00960 [Thalassotalea euphylliae]|uniref:Uncharacterized protein n=1 Tax=Thalassotalea euphylliae TaxID=1655234 RepID=A0A3E0TL35_9GAMM|nr:hypothetical protein [Thalassotalea euphylliae]REL25264.1 hypothetical protein DXX93_00960 [Thalassotalea euphylliae]
MDGNKVGRLSTLFEQVMAKQASINEQFERQVLYEEFMNDSRNNQQGEKQATGRQLRLTR